MMSKIFNDQSKFTISYNYSNPAVFLNDVEKAYVKKVYQPRLKVKRRYLESKLFGQESYDFITNPLQNFDEKSLRRLIKTFSVENKNNIFASNNL